MSRVDEAGETHRFFSPSASGVWYKGGCTASLVVDVSDLVEKRRKDADRGRRLHAETENRLDPKGTDWDPNALPPEDEQAVQVCVDFVLQREGVKLLEYQADLVDGLCGGTSDVVILEPGPDTLEIIDHKFGTGYVDPEGNSQLVIYAAGVMRKLGALGDFKNVHLSIAQPALENFSTWKTTRAEVLSIAGEVEDVVDQVMEGDVEFVASENNCRFCRAKPICPEHIENVNRAARDAFFPLEKDEEHLAARVLDVGAADLDWGERLRMVPLLRQLCKAWEGTAGAKIISGEEVPGFKAVEGRKGNRFWEDRRGAVDTMTGWGLDEKDIYTDPELISPAQAEKKAKASAKVHVYSSGEDERSVAKERKEELEEFWSEGAPGPPTIVPEDDKRPGINRDDLAKRDFAEFIEGAGIRDRDEDEED